MGTVNHTFGVSCDIEKGPFLVLHANWFSVGRPYNIFLSGQCKICGSIGSPGSFSVPKDIVLRAGQVWCSALVIILIPLTGGLLQMYGLVTLQGPLFTYSFMMKPQWAPTLAPLACRIPSCWMYFQNFRSPAEVPIVWTFSLLGSKVYLKPKSNCH